MKNRFCLTAILLLPFLSSTALAGENPQNLLQLATNPVLTHALYNDPSHMLSGVGKVGDNGAVSGNMNGGLVKIESQRWGGDLVAGALAAGRDPSQGLNVIAFGAAQMQPDGSFGPQNDFQGISFFIEAWARSLLLLQQSGNPAYTSYIASQIPRLEQAARWYVSSGDFSKQDSKCNEFTHRCFLNATALGETAQLSGDRQLAGLALQSAQKGLSRQLSDGTFPEKGGFDVNYNALSLRFASQYLLLCPNHAFQTALQAGIRKGGERLALAVQPDGSISTEDSTRTGRDQKHDNSGHSKGVDHKGIIPGLVYAGEVTGDTALEAQAQKVAAGRNW